jgi:hypothetical protein
MGKRRTRRGTLFLELFAVFIGALGAFVSDRIIQSQIETREYKETLQSLEREIASDTVSLKSEIRSPYLRSKQQLSTRFKFWLVEDRIPRDSLDLLLNEMLYYELPSNIVNFKVLQINHGIDQITNLNLKRLIYEYYTDAENADKYHEKISEDNMNAIIKQYDIRSFGTELKSNFKNQFVRSSTIDNEVVNRALLYENHISEIEQVLLMEQLKADTILSIIKKELVK